MQNSRARQSRIFVGVTLLALAIVVMPCVASANATDNTPNEERLINIDVRDGAIQSVLQMLAKAAGVNIVIDESVTGRVEAMTLRDVTVETALRMLTMTKGYHWHKEGNCYVVTAEPVAGAGYESPVQSGGPGGGLVPNTPGGTTSVRTPPPAGGIGSPVTTGNAGTPGVVAPPMVSPGDSQINVAQDDTEPTLIVKLIKLKFTDAEELAYAFGGDVIGSRMPGHRYQSDRPSLRKRAYQRNMGGSSGPDIFGGGSASRWNQDNGLGGGRSSSRGSSFGGDSGGRSTGGRSGSGGGSTMMLPGEMEPPTAFLDQNALIVKGTQDEIDQFTEIINMLDVKTREVEIAAKFVNVQTTGQDALGIDWSVSNGALEFWNLGFAPAAATNNVIRYSRGRFNATLAALVTNGRATVVNEPRVTCPNNQFAEVNFYTTIPYFIAESEYNQFGQRVATTVESEEVDVENSLYVMPRINADDSVTLFLEPTLEDQVGEVVGPNGETIPIITTQYVSTTVTVPDGDTVVMGGLIRKDESTTYNRTPLLEKIPIIGSLFRSKNFRTSNSELLIFVTPRVIRDLPPQ